MTPEQTRDLIERLEKADENLKSMAIRARCDIADHPDDDIRLAGKAAGVRLALSYLREYLPGGPLAAVGGSGHNNGDQP